MAMAPSAAVMGSGAAVTNEAMMDFLKHGIALMTSEETRAMLRCPAQCPEPGLKLIELQRQGWDVLGVDRDLGCQALESLGGPGSTGLLQAKQEFCITAMRTFLQCLEDRKPAVLETKKQMTRAQIIGFTDACNTKMDLPETHMAMAKFVKENKEPPGPIVVEMQRDFLEVFGFEREHGCRMLSRIPQDFPEDRELHQRLMMWKSKAEQMCMHAYKQHMQRAVPMTSVIEQQLEQPEVKAEADRARAEVETMTPEQQEAHMKKMEEKMAPVINLPPGEREEKMRALDVNKYDVVKSQVIMLKRVQDRQKTTAEQDQQTGSSTAGASRPMPAPSMAPPSQQMM